MKIYTASSTQATQPVKILMVLLHGYGADGANLIDLGRAWGTKFPQLECIAPNAPFPCEQGMGYQWASLQNYTPEKMANAIQPVFGPLTAYIDQELQKRGLTHKNLLLMGFSQGAYLALHTALMLANNGISCAGVMGYAGWMHLPPHLPTLVSAFPPVLLVHGTADTVVPIDGSLAAEHFFKQLRAPTTMYTCNNLGHSINMEGLTQGEIFINTVLSNL